jgi:hypothetical protein
LVIFRSGIVSLSISALAQPELRKNVDHMKELVVNFVNCPSISQRLTLKKSPNDFLIESMVNFKYPVCLEVAVFLGSDRPLLNRYQPGGNGSPLNTTSRSSEFPGKF